MAAWTCSWKRTHATVRPATIATGAAADSAPPATGLWWLAEERAARTGSRLTTTSAGGQMRRKTTRMPAASGGRNTLPLPLSDGGPLTTLMAPAAAAMTAAGRMVMPAIGNTVAGSRLMTRATPAATAQ